MKTLREYITETEDRQHRPVAGDVFAFEFDETLLETYVLEDWEDGSVLVSSTPDMLSVLESYGFLQNQDAQMNEAEYQGRKVTLNKRMPGDVKKSKVYVKDPKTGNIKKVNFGDKKMRIKKSNPARRKNFRARHNCDNPGPKTSARYWSCRAW